MAAIDVTETSPGSYRVVVTGSDGTTTHEVTAAPATIADLVGGADLGGAPGSDLVAASFEFLLAREPQHAILASFDLTVITRYFPDYPAEMRRRFEAT